MKTLKLRFEVTDFEDPEQNYAKHFQASTAEEFANKAQKLVDNMGREDLTDDTDYQFAFQGNWSEEDKALLLAWEKEFNAGNK